MRISLDKLNAKNKIIAGVMLFSAAIIILLFLVIIPAVNDINAMSGDIEMKRIDLEEKYLRGQSLRKLAENLKNIEPRLNNLEEIFINKEDALELVTSLEEIAVKNNVAQKINLSMNKNAEQNGYEKIPLQIFAEGRFNNLFNYLLGIEGLNYYINITSIEIASPADKTALEAEKNKKIKITVFADTYWE